MKNLTLIFAFALIVISACTSSNIQEETVAVRTRMLNPLIPDSAVIYPDSDGVYRPILLDIEFINPPTIVTFRCGSLYIYNAYSDDKQTIELQNFVLPFLKLQFRDTLVVQIYNEFIKNYISDNGTGDIYIKGDNIYRIYMHGGKYPPFINVHY
jgi:hypothetical protein